MSLVEKIANAIYPKITKLTIDFVTRKVSTQEQLQNIKNISQTAFKVIDTELLSKVEEALKGYINGSSVKHPQIHELGKEAIALIKAARG